MATSPLQSRGPLQPHEAASTENTEVYAIGQHLLLPRARTLLRAGQPVRIGDRAFDLLLVLCQARGRIVSKDEITRAVWPALHVEEVNIRFQISALRRALGPDSDRIKTVTGRGYLLVADGSSPIAQLHVNGRPKQITVIIERDWDLCRTLAAVSDALSARTKCATSTDTGGVP